MTEIETNETHNYVQDHYGRLADASIALDVVDCCSDNSAASCCDSSSLYDVDTSWLPADMTGFSLGCGDPITLAELQPGQRVLDLGSGGGLDCFLAAQKVGAEGKVIGVDMTPSMIAKAKRNLEKMDLGNIEFRLGRIEAIPADSASIDVIISNCVINLSPDKQAVLNEAFRVLKPGGRLALSDIVTHGRFSAEDRANMAAWTDCISGAEEVGDYVAVLKKAGFANISIRDIGEPTVELASIATTGGPARPFSARITAQKPS